MHLRHSSWCQIVHLVAFFASSFGFLYASGFLFDEDLDPLDDYGPYFTVLLYSLKLIVLLALGPNLFILYGTLFFNDPPTKTYRLPNHCISFRIVTRGDFPDLVRENVNMLIELLELLGCTNFIVEVVCNKAIHLPPRFKVREIVVPLSYSPPNGAKYKARNLHYAIEDSVNQLKDDDWIVHLDEESQLTKDAIIGIFNFINANEHHIGQGLITYGKARIANLTNTLAECYRCAVYIGASRFCFKVMHRPLYSFCGSFIVCTKGVEKRVSFDHGIAGSIAEDAFFALKASNMGYTFDWIEGELLEEASFTFMDLVHQRKRWVQGLWLVHHSKEIKCDLSSFFFKLFHYASLLLPVQFAGDIILTLFPISFFKLDQILAHLNGLVLYYLLIKGLAHSFDLPKLSWARRVCYMLSIVFVKRYWLFAESCAVVWAFMSNRDEFYVIKKQL